MSLKETIEDDLKAALRSRDERRKIAIRMVLAAVHNAEVKERKPLDDAGVISVIKKQVKQHQESIDGFRKGNREDLVHKEEAELSYLLPYLPAALSRDEIERAAREIIHEVGATGPRDKGKVMPLVIARLAGKAEGKEINEIVSGLLSQG